MIFIHSPGRGDYCWWRATRHSVYYGERFGTDCYVVSVYDSVSKTTLTPFFNLPKCLKEIGLFIANDIIRCLQPLPDSTGTIAVEMCVLRPLVKIYGELRRLEPHSIVPNPSEHPYMEYCQVDPRHAAEGIRRRNGVQAAQGYDAYGPYKTAGRGLLA